MKKSELKQELEVAKATLELAMVALRLASKNKFPIGGFVPKNAADKNESIPTDNSLTINEWIEKIRNNEVLSKDGYPIYSIHVDDEMLNKITGKGKPKVGDKVVEASIKAWDEAVKKFAYDDEDPPNETPLTDLAKEVQVEQDKHMDLETNWNNPTVKEMANRLIDDCMPLVNKWKFEGNTIVNQEETYSGVWSYSDNNKRTAAIKFAILLSKHLTHFNEHSKVDLFAVKAELQKMLSE